MFFVQQRNCYNSVNETIKSHNLCFGVVVVVFRLVEDQVLEHVLRKDQELEHVLSKDQVLERVLSKDQVLDVLEHV